MKTYDLSGVWSLALDADKKETKETIVFTDQMNLPGTTDIAQKGKKNEASELGFLTQEYIFEGHAWYQKKITIGPEQVSQPMKLYLERTRKTAVWIDDALIGTKESMVAPHCYDLTGKIKNTTFTITILVDNTGYKTKGGHMTSPDTQTNWNGVIGTMELRIYEDIYIDKIDVFTDLAAGTVTARISIVNTKDRQESKDLSIEMQGRDGETSVRITQKIEVKTGVSQKNITMDLPQNVRRWSEFEPYLYTLIAGFDSEESQEKTVFGVREFKTTEDKFTINGQTTFLRGKSESLLYPLTGCSPMTLPEWLDIMGKVKSYGINHYRCHTCCLPEAAFEAADQLGLYIQPEISFWGTITEPGQEGYNEEEQEYLFQEGMRILDAFGNHPSFVMLSLGNELWGSEKRMNEMMRAYKEKDSRHLYTQGCNNFMWEPKVLDEDDFFVGVRMGAGRLIRGSFAMCDAPQGFVQTMEPCMNYNYDSILRPDLVITSANEEQENETAEYQIQYGTGVKTVQGKEKQGQLIPHVPVINHEVGQYTTYPDFKEIEKYTGVLKPRNLMEFEKRLSEKGMRSLDELFFLASGKLSGDLYKIEAETALRSRYMAGFQLLDLQDFTGQGTALVGILDSLLEEKGTVSKEEWSMFCNSIVLLAEFGSFVLQNDSTWSVKIQAADYGSRNLEGQTIQWQLVELGRKNETFEYGKNSRLYKTQGKEITRYDSYTQVKRIVDQGSLEITGRERGLIDAGMLALKIPKASVPMKYGLNLVLTQEDKMYQNRYEVWAYPQADPSVQSVEQYFKQSIKAENSVCVTSDPAVMKQALNEGGRVLYLPNGNIPSIAGEYATDFWNYPMFRSISESMKKPLPVGTMGLLVDNEHPIFQDFISEIYTTPQWYQLICHAELLLMDDERFWFRPIVQMIDNFGRNHRLGMMLEVKAGRGSVLICTIHLDEIIHTMEAQSLLHALRSYIRSNQFSPDWQLDMKDLEDLLTNKDC